MNQINKLDQALREMTELINSANDVTVDELRKQLDAWHERWIAGSELSEILKAGLLTAFLAVFQIAFDQQRKPDQSPLYRSPDQIAREGGSRPQGGRNATSD